MKRPRAASRDGRKIMKHAYIPRTTTYNLNPGEELNDLRMSDEVRPLYEHVKKFIRETVDPMSVEFMRLGEGKRIAGASRRNSSRYCRKAKDKARRKACGTSSCLMPRPAKA
jgi:acyl-CoA dehydrogenase